MYKRWRCQKCGGITTKFSFICQHLDCDGERGIIRWLLNIDNPVTIILGIVWVLGAAVIFILAHTN